ncbi:hypothetical protein J6590_077573 [Homalodisca vitripennis]|nr:hypothetical protein J6590_077573 [Homalodisca vitripennis]
MTLNTADTKVQNLPVEETNSGHDQESMEWEEVDDYTSLLEQLQKWSIAEDLTMDCDTAENTEYGMEVDSEQDTQE